MNFYITGPTLLDLTRIYNTNAAQIANINVSRMCAYMVGSLSKSSHSIALIDRSERTEIISAF